MNDRREPMRTVSEVSKLTGISVRTLRHYDAIGLLKPAKLTKAGYRLYDDAALERLQSILIFRELEFPLKEIKAILNNPTFDVKEALVQQITLLELRRNHLEELISFARKIQREGVNIMAFQAFEKSEIDKYTEEVKQRWGSTKEYKEYVQKTKGKTKQELDTASNRLMSLFAKIGSLRKLPPAQKEVQEQVKQLQTLITENYYHCTLDVLSGLSQMYVSDERMKRNIDQAGGDGTAEFLKQAISVYCKKKEIDKQESVK